MASRPSLGQPSPCTRPVARATAPPRPDLVSATTDSSGNFQITNAPSCADPQQVYIVATGGNPGSPPEPTTTALVLVAALGNCSSVSASTHVIINEVTTIAAAYALSGFASPTSINIGTSATNPTGLQHAFQNAANIVDFSRLGPRDDTCRQRHRAYEPHQQPRRHSRALRQLHLPDQHSLHDPVHERNAACCHRHSAPVNTWQAALDMAQYPGNNTAALYGLILGTPSFQPTLGAPRRTIFRSACLHSRLGDRRRHSGQLSLGHRRRRK